MADKEKLNYCTSCGAKLAQGLQFCTSCGKALSVDSVKIASAGQSDIVQGKPVDDFEKSKSEDCPTLLKPLEAKNQAAGDASSRVKEKSKDKLQRTAIVVVALIAGVAISVIAYSNFFTTDDIRDLTLQEIEEREEACVEPNSRDEVADEPIEAYEADAVADAKIDYHEEFSTTIERWRNLAVYSFHGELDFPFYMMEALMLAWGLPDGAELHYALHNWSEGDGTELLIGFRCAEFGDISVRAAYSLVNDEVKHVFGGIPFYQFDSRGTRIRYAAMLGKDGYILEQDGNFGSMNSVLFRMDGNGTAHFVEYVEVSGVVVGGTDWSNLQFDSGVADWHFLAEFDSDLW